MVLRVSPNVVTCDNYIKELYFSHYYLLLWSGHSWQDIDTVCREVSSFIGPLIYTMCPTRVEDLFPSVLVQQDQISLLKA